MVTAPRSAPREGARLLLGELRPERRAIALLGVILVVAVGLPVGAQLLLGRFVDEAAAGAAVGRLVNLAITFGALLLVADVLQLAVTAMSVRLAWRVGNRLRVHLCRHALALDLSWHGEHSAGEVIERVDGDIEAVTKFASTAVLQVVGNIAVLLTVGVVALVIEWRAGLVLLATVGVALGVLLRMRTIAVPYHDHEREVLGRLYGDLEERLGGLEDIRANGAGPWAVDRLHRSSARWWRAARQASLRGDGGYAATGITFAVGTAVTLGIASVLATRGQATLGTVLVLFRFVQMVQSPLERIGEQLSEFQKAVAGLRRAARLLGTPVGIQGGTQDLPPGALAVDLDAVDLRYGTSEGALPDGPPAGAPVAGSSAGSAVGGCTVGRSSVADPSANASTDDSPTDVLSATTTSPRTSSTAGAVRAGFSAERASGPGASGPGASGPGASAVSVPTRPSAPAPFDNLALAGIELHLAAGTSLGVVGRTGSGKTSLGRLLARFWDPTAGAVRVGGVDLRDADATSRRRRIAVVTQEVEVLRASLRDNLTLLGAVPADDDALCAALVDVGLDQWAADLPDGLDTVLDGATRLSGGEAQLLAFARVLLGDPGLVLLDEATSRLDAATEDKVRAATRRLRRDRTLVVIAHRLSTIDDLDEVAVMEAGRIVEHGRRDSLAADPTSRFARLLAVGADHGIPG